LAQNLLITQHKSGRSCILFPEVMVLSENFEDPDSGVPAYSFPSSGLVTTIAGASCRGFWSMHSQRFEF